MFVHTWKLISPKKFILTKGFLRDHTYTNMIVKAWPRNNRFTKNAKIYICPLRETLLHNRVHEYGFQTEFRYYIKFEHVLTIQYWVLFKNCRFLRGKEKLYEPWQESNISNLYLAMLICWRLSALSTDAEYTAFNLSYTSLPIQSVYMHTLLKLNVVLYSMCICPTKCDKYLFGHHG